MRRSGEAAVGQTTEPMRGEYCEDQPIRGRHYLDLARLEAVTGAAAEEERGLGGEKLA